MGKTLDGIDAVLVEAEVRKDSYIVHTIESGNDSKGLLPLSLSLEIQTDKDAKKFSATAKMLEKTDIQEILDATTKGTKIKLFVKIKSETEKDEATKFEVERLVINDRHWLSVTEVTPV